MSNRSRNTFSLTKKYNSLSHTRPPAIITLKKKSKIEINFFHSILITDYTRQVHSIVISSFTKNLLGIL